MTVSTTIRKAGPFAGTGLVSSFPFSFKVFTAADLLVVRTASGGADTTLVLTTDYTVTLNPDQDAVPGGSVVLGSPLAVGFTLSIGSQVDSLQGLSLTNGGGFFPKAIEAALDKLDIQDQQQEETLSRAVRVPFGSGAIPDLPAPSAGSALVWNTAGTALENGVPGVAYDTLKADLASAASGKGAALVAFSHANTYASGTVGLGVDWSDNVKNAPYGAVGNNTADDTAAIQAAITACASAGGGIVYIPPGTYKCTSTINMAANVVLRGAGKRAATLSFTHTGDGVKMTSPINSSTAVNTVVIDLGIICTNGSNTGGGYVDVGGSFVAVERCYFQGWKYGVIYDQTEIATVAGCVFNAQITAGVWLANFADHTPGALSGFTNRITIRENHFNCAATAYDVLDDGGVTHTVTDNNFNGGLQSARFAGVTPLTFRSNECEAAAGANISFHTTTLAGTATLNSACVKIESNTFIPVAAQTAVNIVNASSVVSENNSYSSALSAAPSITIGTLFHFKAIGDRAGNAISGVASFHYTNDSLTNGFPIATSGQKFGNPGAASTGAVTNTLVNNYEEGTFTPTIVGTTTAGAGTYTTQTATYTRVGNLVTFSLTLVWTAHTGTGAMKISGLPFASKNTTNLVNPFAVTFDALVIGAGKQLGAAVIPGSTQISLYSLDVAGGALALLTLDTAATVNVAGTYQV